MCQAVGLTQEDGRVGVLRVEGGRKRETEKMCKISEADKCREISEQWELSVVGHSFATPSLLALSH